MSSLKGEEQRCDEPEETMQALCMVSLGKQINISETIYTYIGNNKNY